MQINLNFVHQLIKDQELNTFEQLTNEFNLLVKLESRFLIKLPNWEKP